MSDSSETRHQLFPLNAPGLIGAGWRTLVRCNPFYLASALLLVYGIYRLSVDPKFFSTDTRQLLFSFGSMEVYSAALLGAVLFLGARKIWYDAALLVFLQNFLALIPFMLISHAVFLEDGLALALCATACLTSGFVYGGFKGGISKINLPPSLLLSGLAVLVVNSALPLIFRRGLEVNNELWNARSLYCWQLWLPLLSFLGLFLPIRPGRAGVEEHEKASLPLVTFLLWMTGTAVHLYTVGYVDEQKFTFWHSTVLLWAVSWVVWVKMPLLATPPLASQTIASLAFVPAFAGLLVLGISSPFAFLAVQVVNAAAFGFCAWREPRVKIYQAWAGASLLAGWLAVPARWLHPLSLPQDKFLVLLIAVLVVIIFLSIRRWTPLWGFLGGYAFVLLAFGVSPDGPLAQHLAIQSGIVFLLLHSLLWKKTTSGMCLIAVAIALWGWDAVLLEQSQIRFAKAITPAASSLLLLGVLAARRLLNIHAQHLILAAVGVLLLTQVWQAAEGLKSTPAGLVAVVASFGLLAGGTCYAVLRPRLKPLLDRIA